PVAAVTLEVISFLPAVTAPSTWALRLATAAANDVCARVRSACTLLLWILLGFAPIWVARACCCAWISDCSAPIFPPTAELTVLRPAVRPDHGAVRFAGAASI